MRISFVVPGTPIAKGRHITAALKRCSVCGRKTVRPECPQHPGSSMAFMTNIEMTPKGTVMYENMVGLSARAAMTGEKLSGALRMEVAAYLPIPASRVKKLKEGDPHTQRPDADNILKAICDGCNGVLWADDCCVFDKRIIKRWTHGQARAEVMVEEL